jgi:NAD(P)-dependent dehydrogenase (short-subunit alcohol dehydrogenase family)
MTLLETKTAIVYGAGGSIGSAVARAFAREGARVFLAGRARAAPHEAAQVIRGVGGTAQVTPVDALGRPAVVRHASAVADAAGGIDIASNEDVQGTPLLNMSYKDFIRPVTKGVTSQFVTATAVARNMRRHGSGVILAMADGRGAIPLLGGSHVTWAALAALCRRLACELGPEGIRVAWLLSPDASDPGLEAADVTMLGRRPTWTRAPTWRYSLLPTGPVA